LNLVIDASLTMAWYFADETTEVTEELFDRVTARGALVPGHWRLEVANAFQSAIRRKRSDAVYRDASLADLMLLPITIDSHTNSYAWSATLRLAEKFSLTGTGSRPPNLPATTSTASPAAQPVPIVRRWRRNSGAQASSPACRLAAS
jgi:predicted nucleic acid-binding protein